MLERCTFRRRRPYIPCQNCQLLWQQIWAVAIAGAAQVQDAGQLTLSGNVFT